MDWSGFLNNTIKSIKQLSKAVIKQDVNISKIIFTGSAIAMVSIALASSFMSNSKPPKPKNKEEEKEKKLKREKKKKTFVLKDRHFLTEEEEDLSDYSTTANGGDSKGRSGHGRVLRRHFASDYEGDERFVSKVGKRKHEKKVRRDAADDLYFMIFDKLNSEE